MVQPAACIRCHGTELVTAHFEGIEPPRLATDAQHASPVHARVCLTCGAVMLTVTTPGALRTGEPPDADIQEYDF
jgi:hypothetical protein